MFALNRSPWTSILASVLLALCLTPAQAQILPDAQTLSPFAHPLVIEEYVVGDIDDDGIPDYSPNFLMNGVFGLGRPVYSGRTGSLIRTLDGLQDGLTSPSPILSINYPTMRSLADLDGDQVQDLAILFNDSPSSHLLVVRSGANNDTLLTIPLIIGPNNQTIRFDTVALVGSLGRASGQDLVALYQTPLGDEVRRYDGVTGSLLAAFPAPFEIRSICGAGDHNADGVEDWYVSLPILDFPADQAGRVVLISGLDGAELNAWGGFLEDENFGSVIAPLGDGEGAGPQSLMVLSPGVELPDNAVGRVRVFSADGSLRHRFDPRAEERYLSMARASDLDGDGVAEVKIYVSTATPIGFVPPQVPLGSTDQSRVVFYRYYSTIDGRIVRESRMEHPEQMITPGLPFLVPPRPSYEFAAADANGDGFGEILRFERGSGLMISYSASVISAMGALNYNQGSGLSLEWASTLGVFGAGEILVSAPSASSNAVVFISGAPASGSIEVSGTATPLNVSLGDVIDSLSVPLSSAGSFQAPLNLAQPALEGLVLYLQCFVSDASGGLTSSPGLEVLFGR